MAGPAARPRHRMSDALQALQKALREFARERDWEQFHSPK